MSQRLAVSRRVEALLRRAIPSLAILTRNPAVGSLLDVSDRVLGLPYPEFRALPPNRYRVRVGVGNRLLFNQAYFLAFGAETWLDMFAEGLASSASKIVDIGSGCGRFAYPLKRSNIFSGSYIGIDADAEMVAWCVSNFPSDRFTFIHADVYNSVYNPTGRRGPYVLPIPEASQDLVMSQSLFTHLLEEELEQYVHESFRVLGHRAHMVMSVFCLDHLSASGDLAGRWSFKYRVGWAYVQNRSHPEAAVAYEEPYLMQLCTRAGFAEVRLRPGASQSFLVCRKA